MRSLRCPARLLSLAARQGFDEYMNLVLDEAEEVSMKRKTRKPLGARGADCSLVKLLICDLPCSYSVLAWDAPVIKKSGAQAPQLLIDVGVARADTAEGR